MLSHIGTWIASNWKWVSVVGGALIGAGVGVHDYVDTVNDRLSEVEQADHALVEEIGKVKCMIVLHHMGEDPMSCELER